MALASSKLAVPIGTFPGGVGCGTAPCSAGQACCDVAIFMPTTCVSSFDDCDCASGHCQVRGCVKPADCLGQVCCAISNPGGPLSYSSHIATSCKPMCDPVHEAVVCTADADCSGGAFCVKGGSDHGIGVCF